MPDYSRQTSWLMNFNPLVAPALSRDDADIGFRKLEGFGEEGDSMHAALINITFNAKVAKTRRTQRKSFAGRFATSQDPQLDSWDETAESAGCAIRLTLIDCANSGIHGEP